MFQPAEKEIQNLNKRIITRKNILNFPLLQVQ